MLFLAWYIFARLFWKARETLVKHPLVYYAQEKLVHFRVLCYAIRSLLFKYISGIRQVSTNLCI